MIGMEEKKYWYQYGLVFYWWTFKRLIDLIVRQPLCWLGIHRAYDGFFHSCIDEFGDSDSVKCYHCRYCHRPADQRWHDRYTNGEDWRMNISDIMKLAFGMSLVALAIKTIEDVIKRERAR